MQKAPSFAVVVAAYQAAGFIGEAIESALSQDPPPSEVIIGDDGSTDDLSGALEQFGDAVTVVRIDHHGEGAAKNAAVEAASAEFIAFLDADDRFLPGRLAALGAAAIARPELDVITTDAFLTYQGEILGRCYGAGYRFEEADQRTAILRGNFVLGLSAVRRDRFLAIGGFDTTIAYTVDWDLWIRLILGGSIVGFVDEPLAEYRLHPDSMSARRAAMSRGRLDSIARTEARPDLSASERLVLASTRRTEESRLAWEELKERLLDNDYGGARRRAARVIVGAGQPRSGRLKAALALALPSLATRTLRREDEAMFVSVGDRRLPRPVHGDR